ncbi:hypothetical protein ACIQD3_11775 [Peribacillus loiseleuriae]|uniref:hypothetical protein n=1 Tax=Peribacillus loiseleuriae TaxID=1679170 RepID=UPI00382DBE22
MKKHKKEWLIEELYRWVTKNGKIPCRDDMKKVDGYPSANQYAMVFETRKWNEILTEIGIEPNNTFWTIKEEQFLYENWKNYSDEEIAILLNKKVGGVKYKRVELGLFRQSQKQPWQDWEIGFLIENFFEGDEDWICKVLSHRKWETIRAYATKNLKLRRKHKLYKYQVEEGKRICRECKKLFPESTEYFYKDGNGYRTMCIYCYNIDQERKARERGILTRKLVQEKFETGNSHCGKCDTWKSVYEFRNDHNDLRQLHRWCEECEIKYMREYHLKRKYGDNYEEMYFEKNKHMFDLNGFKWDSIDEKDIANWLINTQFVFEKGPYYKDVFEGDFSKRRFDWIVWVGDKTYLVEYFGLWNTKSKFGRIEKYVKEAKKKIEKMYRNRDKFNFIIIFPADLKYKKLFDIFSQRTF